MHDIDESTQRAECEPEEEPKVEIPAGCLYRVVATAFVLFMLWLAYTLLDVLAS